MKKQRTSRTFWRRAGWRGAPSALSALALFGCAASPESDSPGSCPINCSSPRVASSDVIIEKAVDVNFSVECPARDNEPTYDLSFPIQVKYKVYKRISNFGWGAGSTSNTTEGGNSGGAGGATTATHDRSQPIVPTMPIAGVGFEPLVTGGMSINRTADEFKSTPTEANPYKFAGIVTSQSEWCSDSCGIITYEFWPLCVSSGENPVTANVLVHGAGAKAPPFTFDIRGSD